MKKLFLASASVLTLVSACAQEEVDRAGILQKFPGVDAEALAQDIGIERLTTTFGDQTIVANVLREGISEELSEEDIANYVGGIAEVAEAMITGETIEHGDGEGAFIGFGGITPDSEAEGIIGAMYTQGSDEDMVGVAIVPGIIGESFMVIASGTEVSNIPTAGEFSYEGSNFMTNLGEDEIDGDYGTFEASVNFATGKGVIDLDFENKPVMIDGDFNVDTATGIFVGDDLEINSMGGVNTATIHGNFHGDGATGMTGIYTDNVAEPNFIGAIAEHQVTPTIIIGGLVDQ